MLKKFFNLLMILCVTVFFAGCSDDSPKPPKTKKEKVTETTPITSSARLYGEDLQITQDEFVSVYNNGIDELAKSKGKNYDDLKIITDDPRNIEEPNSGTIHFYSGKHGFISLFKNSADSSKICAAMITAKANFKLSDMLVEVEALTQAATQKQHNSQNVIDFFKTPLQTQTSNATSIDGLVVSYNSVGNYLTIITEDSTAGNGFERMVDNIIDSAKMGSYWQK